MPHPTQVELLLPATPQAPRMTRQTQNVVIVVPACRPAQATTMKMTRETEVERQRQPTKVLHLPASVNIPARCKNNKHKKLRMRPLEGGGRPLPPPLGYATAYMHR